MECLLTLPTVLCIVNGEDDSGGSALDWACVSGCLPVIEMLVRQPAFHTPTKHHSSNKRATLSLLSSRMDWGTQFPIKPYFRVFMAGNSG